MSSSVIYHNLLPYKVFICVFGYQIWRELDLSTNDDVRYNATLIRPVLDEFNAQTLHQTLDNWFTYKVQTLQSPYYRWTLSIRTFQRNVFRDHCNNNKCVFIANKTRHINCNKPQHSTSANKLSKPQVYNSFYYFVHVLNKTAAANKDVYLVKFATLYLGIGSRLTVCTAVLIKLQHPAI